MSQGYVSTMTAERLHNERNVWMATVRPDGRPHLAPVWFVYVDDRLWIGTGAGSVRARNLIANPAATVSLESGDAPLVAEGVVVVHPSERPAAVVEVFAGKYSWDITVADDPDLGRVALLEFRPRRWLFGAALPVVADD